MTGWYLPRLHASPLVTETWFEGGFTLRCWQSDSRQAAKVETVQNISDDTDTALSKAKANTLSLEQDRATVTVRDRYTKARDSAKSNIFDRVHCLWVRGVYSFITICAFDMLRKTSRRPHKQIFFKRSSTNCRHDTSFPQTKINYQCNSFRHSPGPI